MKSKLETRIDKELAELGVKPYVYYIRAYGEGFQRRILGSFNAITIVDTQYQKTAQVERDVGGAMDGLANSRMTHGDNISPATWVMAYLHKMGYHGVAICDRRDYFSRKRGRIIAKGRLLKHLKLPNFSDGTKW